MSGAVLGGVVGGVAGAGVGHTALVLANPIIAGSPIGLAATGAAGAAGAAGGAFIGSKLDVPDFLNGWF